MKIARFRSYPIIELDSEEKMDRLGLRDWSILFSSDDLQAKAKEMIRYLRDYQGHNILAISRLGQETYYDQNLTEIEKWSTHPILLKDKKAKQVHAAMSIERNIFWMDKMVSIIEQQPTFIMIGVAHLPGKKGVINLLRKKGFIVQPIR